MHALLQSGSISYDALTRCFVIDNLYPKEEDLHAAMLMPAARSCEHRLDVRFYVDGGRWGMTVSTSNPDRPLTVRDMLDALHSSVQQQLLHRPADLVGRPTYRARPKWGPLDPARAYRWTARFEGEPDPRNGRHVSIFLI